ncbi:hypothetical protein F4778DRAFT_379516 [Xylariomycetidae sp. FL2044]|nr:hypothetical protein F4778DRAFT_379516 [Xylariomycetidae sp. FL2044]
MPETKTQKLDPVDFLLQLAQENPNPLDLNKRLQTIWLVREKLFEAALEAQSSPENIPHRLRSLDDIRTGEDTWWSRNKLDQPGVVLPTGRKLIYQAIRHECPDGVQSWFKNPPRPGSDEDQVQGIMKRAAFQLYQAAWDIFPLLQRHFKQIDAADHHWTVAKKPRGLVEKYEQSVTLHYLKTVGWAMDTIRHDVEKFGRSDLLQLEAWGEGQDRPVWTDRGGDVDLIKCTSMLEEDISNIEKADVEKAAPEKA